MFIYLFLIEINSPPETCNFLRDFGVDLVKHFRLSALLISSLFLSSLFVFQLLLPHLHDVGVTTLGVGGGKE